MALKNQVGMSDQVDAVLGELSQFNLTHGFYVHGLTLESAEFPRGWEKRAVHVRNDNTDGNTGICVEAHDLAASKLFANRDKDRIFVRILLQEGLVTPNKLVRSIDLLEIDGSLKSRLLGWVDGTWKDLQS